jgi:hypothetical protein
MHQLFFDHIPGTIGTERTQYSKVTPIIVFFQKKGRASYLTAEITGSAFLLIRQIRENKAITDHFQELLFLGESIENHSLIRDFCCCKRFPL